ncbi:hypothetical protein O6H91_10G045300 [Diphasiastrum complanatum]|nr:hypothetical protein O6H91_10G045300 [Diphasiastrum complanatum]
MEDSEVGRPGPEVASLRSHCVSLSESRRKAYFDRVVSKVLFGFSRAKRFREDIALKGGAALLIKHVLSEQRAVQIRACITLGRLSKACSVEFLTEAVAPLMELLRAPPDCASLHLPSTQEASAFALGRLARKGEELSSEIGSLGALPILCGISLQSSGRLQRTAMKALRELVNFSERNHSILFQSAGLESILEHIMSSDPAVRLFAAEVLATMASSREVRRAIVNLSGIPALIEAARIGRFESRTRAAHALGHLAFTKRIRRTIVDADAIPVLVDLLQEGDLPAKLVAGNTLGILAAHVDHLRPVAQAGAIPLFVNLLEGTDSVGKEIAEDAFCILAVSEENAITIADHLVRILQSSSVEAKAGAADIVWDLASYKHSVSVVRASGAIPLLVTLLREENEEARERASGALAQLSYDENDRRAMVEAGVIPVLVELIADESNEVKENVAEALHNLAEDSSYSLEMSEAAAIAALRDLQDSYIGGSRVRDTTDHTSATLRYLSLRQFL